MKTNTIKQYHIYRLYCRNNGKSYIGQTTNPQHRFYKSHYSNPELLADIERYGTEAFTAEVIARTSDRSFAKSMEEHFVDEYDAINNGYNRCRNFNVSVYCKRTEEANAKRRQAISKTVWMYDPSTGQSTRANPARAKELAEKGWLNGRIKEDAHLKGSSKNMILKVDIPEGTGDYFKAAQ